MKIKKTSFLFFHTHIRNVFVQIIFFGKAL